MKTHLFFVLLISCMTQVTWAESRAATLSVSGMNCALCPVTVQKALEKVGGVTQVAVNYEEKSVTVIYDDQKASMDKLTKATQDAGYPSTVVNQE